MLDHRRAVLRHIGAVLALYCAGLVPATAASAAGAIRPVELRGIWIDNGYLARLGGRPGVARLMEQLREAGFNAIFPETMFRGYTLYQGPYQDRRFAGWGEDPLTVVVQEARRQGLAVHAWMWMLAAGINGKPGPLLAAHPEWADAGLSGTAHSATGGLVAWMDPSRRAVQEFLAEQAALVAHRYEVDGIHLDYVRYNDDLHDPFGYSEHALEAFRVESGLDPAGRRPDELPAVVRSAWKAWRESRITELVEAVTGAVSRARPGTFISAAVMPEPAQARLVHLQDWRTWLANGLVDAVMPMAYTSSQANLQDVLRSCATDLDGLSPYRDVAAIKRQVVVGLALFANRPETLPQQVEAVRQAGFGGVILFAASYLSQPLRRALLAPQAFGGEAALHPPAVHAAIAGLPAVPPEPFPEPAPASYPALQGPQGVPNLAPEAEVVVDSSFRGYTPSVLNDGQRNDVSEVGRWAEVAWAAAETEKEHWIELRWHRPVTILQVDIYWAPDRGRYFSSSSLRVEALDVSDDTWHLLWEYTQQPTHAVARTSATFAPVKATALRLWQPPGGGPKDRPGLMWVSEVEVFGDGELDALGATEP